MLIVNILSSTLYLPLVLLSLFFVTSDDGLVTSDAGLIQGLLFNFISQFIGALSVLSTLCTGLTIPSRHNIVSKIDLIGVGTSNTNVSQGLISTSECVILCTTTAT